MSSNPRIEIKSIGGENGSIFSEIYVDGHKLRGVRSFRLEKTVGEKLPTLTVDLNALNLAIDHTCLLKQEGFGEIEINFKD